MTQYETTQPQEGAIFLSTFPSTKNGMVWDKLNQKKEGGG